MLRVGMIKQSSAGIYSWLPLGFKVMKKIEKIVREEQDRIGAQELLMPTIQSSELWKEWKDLGWNSSEKDPNNDTTWRYYDGYFEEDYAWPKNKSNMDKIKEVALNSKIIHVTGGAPTLNPEFFYP